MGSNFAILICLSGRPYDTLYGDVQVCDVQTLLKTVDLILLSPESDEKNTTGHFINFVPYARDVTVRTSFL